MSVCLSCYVMQYCIHYCTVVNKGMQYRGLHVTNDKQQYLMFALTPRTVDVHRYLCDSCLWFDSHQIIYPPPPTHTHTHTHTFATTSVSVIGGCRYCCGVNWSHAISPGGLPTSMYRYMLIALVFIGPCIDNKIPNVHEALLRTCTIQNVHRHQACVLLVGETARFNVSIWGSSAMCDVIHDIKSQTLNKNAGRVSPLVALFWISASLTMAPEPGERSGGWSTSGAWYYKRQSGTECILLCLNPIMWARLK